MSGSGEPKKYSADEILLKFQGYIEKRKPGLKRFYKSDESLKPCATTGSVMTQKLVDSGCPVEVAAELTLLALWDLVVLIGTNCLHMFVLVLYPRCFLLHPQ